jgi:hypothetical protein
MTWRERYLFGSKVFAYVLFVLGAFSALVCVALVYTGRVDLLPSGWFFSLGACFTGSLHHSAYVDQLKINNEYVEIIKEYRKLTDELQQKLKERGG